jgi:TRAP-type C4-dicarboxylate transport system permease small subunit
MLLKALQTLAKVNYWLSHVAKNIAGFMLALMVVLILGQVFFRYVLNDSLPWTEELAKFMMVWVACLVAPWAYRENLNVSIEMFADALPLKLRQLSELLISILVILVSGIFFVESIEFWQGGLSIYASSMPFKLAYFYACTPFAFATLCLVGIERFVEQLYCFVVGTELIIKEHN